MQKQLSLVKIFHEKFNVPIGLSPYIIPSDRISFRYNQLKEEVEEYFDGAKMNDLENVSKEICDILYVLYGTIIEHGLQDKIEDIFAEVHKSNMSKEYHEYKMIKGEGYFKPDISKLIN